jgi:hypothetical protein
MRSPAACTTSSMLDDRRRRCFTSWGSNPRSPSRAVPPRAEADPNQTVLDPAEIDSIDVDSSQPVPPHSSGSPGGGHGDEHRSGAGCANTAGSRRRYRRLPPHPQTGGSGHPTGADDGGREVETSKTCATCSRTSCLRRGHRQPAEAARRRRRSVRVAPDVELRRDDLGAHSSPREEEGTH